MGQDLAPDLLAQRAPARERGGKPELLGVAEGAVDGDPGHHFRADEVAARAAYLPEAFVGQVPVRLDEVDEGAGERPHLPVVLEAARRAWWMVFTTSP